MTITDTPQNTCPHCGAELYSFPNQNEETTYWRCGTRFSKCLKMCFRQSGCYERELNASKAEVERLKTVKDYWANLWADLNHAAISDNVRLEKRAEKAEAEVESLTEKLTSLQEAYLKSAERDNSLTKELFDSRAEIESLSKLTEDCLNVIRVYCPIYYNDAMDRFKTINKCTH